MEPKKARTENGSSSSGMGKYDKKVFVSKKAYEHLLTALEKNNAWVPERGFDLSMHHPYPRLMGIIEDRKWLKLCAQPGPTITLVVREFYANATARNDLIVVVQGVEVSYSAAKINAYYELRDFKMVSYSASESNLDLEAILHVICSRCAQWRMHENPH